LKVFLFFEYGKNQQLKKEIGLLDASMIVIGSMIGSGIFIVSADVTRNLGSPDTSSSLGLLLVLLRSSLPYRMANSQA
jgi:APA family basic amino acid/polyamine antiporter